MNTTVPRVEQFVLSALPEAAKAAGFVGFYWGDPQTGVAAGACPDVTGAFRESVTGGYSYQQRVGGVLRYNPGGAIPLCRYWSPAQTNHRYSVSCAHAAEQQNGYTFVRVEGWV